MLLLSSVTCQAGVFAIERHQMRRTGSIWNPRRWGLREWYVLTFLMGLYFVCGQGYEYLDLIRKQHVTLSSSNYGSVFFLTTGFHGLHVTGGLIAFIFLLGRTFAAKRFTLEQQTSAIVVSYYWHFVDVVWIGLVHDHLPDPLTGTWGSCELDHREAPTPGGRVCHRRVRAVLIGTAYAVVTSGTASASPPVAANSAQIARGPQSVRQATARAATGSSRRARTGSAPSLIGVGAAAVDFQVSTGRMPAEEQSAPRMSASRHG